MCQIVAKNISTQTLPVTECKSTSTEENVERDSLNLSSEFITPSLVSRHTNGYYADKECSTPSTVPLGLEVAPSLGGRFHVNMLKDKYRANRNKGITISPTDNCCTMFIVVVISKSVDDDEVEA